MFVGADCRDFTGHHDDACVTRFIRPQTGRDNDRTADGNAGVLADVIEFPDCNSVTDCAGKSSGDR